MNHREFQKHNMLRTTSWRYDRVLELVDARPRKAASRRYDDEFVREYRQFLPRYLDEEHEINRKALFPHFPAIYYAHELHFSTDTEWRAMLQAFILAGETDGEIANRLCSLPDAIKWYESLFFNVRDRLDKHTWIVKAVLGTSAYRAANREGSMTVNQRDLVYKLFAYFGGPVILDVIISGFVRGLLPKKREEIKSWFDQTYALLIRQRATIAARLFEVNKYNVMQLFEIHCAIMAGERSASEGGPQTNVEKNVEALMKAVPWNMGKTRIDHLSELQQKYLLSAVEPRADEQMALAAGIMPDSLLQAEQDYGHSEDLLSLPIGQ